MPGLIRRPRTGANRVGRYRSLAAAVVIPGTDPITVGSIIYDFWWQSGVTYLGAPATNGGSVDAWQERYATEVAISSGSPFQSYSSASGVRNGASRYMTISNPTSLVPPFTVYVLCNYGGTSLYPICGAGSGELSNLSVTAGLSLMQDTTSLITLSGTVTGTGAKLFRWRVNASGTAYFKDGSAVEENLGSFGTSNFINWENIFGIPGTVYEATDNYTQRITAFGADLVTLGTSTAVETYINAAG